MGFESRMRDITIGATTVITIVSLYIAWNIYKGSKGDSPRGVVYVNE